MKSIKIKLLICLTIPLVSIHKIFPQDICSQKDHLEGILSYYNTEIKNVQDDFSKRDFSSILLKNKKFYIGYIGRHKRRLEIDFSSIQKDATKKYTYTIKGETIVGENKRKFKGYIQINNVCKYNNISYGVDNIMKDQVKSQGIAIAKCRLEENKELPSTGIFEGKIFIRWYIDTGGNLLYDDIEDHSDSYSNNEFIGNWTSYKTGNQSLVAWGQYRIPCSGDLDIGVSEFYPNEKYHNYGWADYKP